ncbi:hypothetical protein [Spirosoma areae]
MNKLLYLSLSIFCFTMSCQPDKAIVLESEQSAKNNGNARLAAAGLAVRRQLGTVRDASLDEISGVVQSRTNPGYLWVHEDSGNPNKIYLLDEQGFTKATFTLPANAPNRDWEDITIGRGPQAFAWYIYLADTGDNGSVNSKIYIYRFIEPSIAGKPLPYNKTLSDSEVNKLDFRYADGPRNAETLMIDPLTRDLFIITKETTKGGVYKAAYPQSNSGTTTLTRSGTVNISTATGGDISANGSEILIKNYTTVYYWKKSSVFQTTSQLLATSPGTLPYIEEPGGEAIACKTDGSGYYTISEVKQNIPAAIYFYQR